jgi:arylsulfatase A-like enzyme
MRGGRAGRFAALAIVLLALAAVYVRDFAAPDGSLAGAQGPSGRAARPSILLITIDTIRPDGLPFTGSTRNTAPFLTELARRSLVFRNAWSTSSWTVPAVSSFLTGLYPSSHGVVHGVLRNGAIFDQEMIADEHVTVVEEMKKLGYRTFGVASNAHLAPELGYGRGFDRYLCVGVTPADSVNAALLRWKKAIEAPGPPVFLWVHYYDPHHPYRQHEPWFGEFQPGVTVADGRLLMQAKGSPPVLPRDKENRERFIGLARALYDSEVRFVDEAIAGLFRDLPLLNDWVTIVTGDHGEEFLDHGSLTHCHNLYNETVKVPFLVHWPDGRGAGSSDAVVSLVDLPPTILGLAGGVSPATWSGIPIFGSDRSVSIPADRRIVAELERNRGEGVQQALVTLDWKLIRNLKTGRTELFDLKADPGELRNRTATEAVRASALTRELDAFMMALPAPPKTVARRPVSKGAEIELKGQGYIH